MSPCREDQKLNSASSAASSEGVLRTMSDIVFLKLFCLWEAGTIAVLKRLGDKSQVVFLEVALAFRLRFN
jgi:hypothetical protein